MILTLFVYRSLLNDARLKRSKDTLKVGNTQDIAADDGLVSLVQSSRDTCLTIQSSITIKDIGENRLHSVEISLMGGHLLIIREAVGERVSALTCVKHAGGDKPQDVRFHCHERS